jgi:hypothetical protein
MSDNIGSKYLWVMEWYDPFDSPPSTAYDIYRIEPQAGVKEEDIEKFMTDEMFPAVGIRATRRAHVVRHYLLKQRGDVRDSLNQIFDIYVHDKSIPAKFESLSTSTALHGFDVVGSWESRESQVDGE